MIIAKVANIFKQNNKIKGIFDEIQGQNNFRGFTVFTDSYGKRSDDLLLMTNTILRSISRVATVALINTKNVDVKKLVVSRMMHRISTAKPVTRVNGTHPSVFEGQNCLPIWLTTINSNLKKVDTILEDSIKFLNRKTRIFRQMPKFLIVVVQRHNHNLRKLYNLHEVYNSNFDYQVLAITVSKTTSKKLKLTYRLHQSNCYSRTHKKSNYKKGIEWFPDKTRNLHKHKIYWRCMFEKVDYADNTRNREYTYTASLKAMNATVVYLPRKSKPKRNFECIATYIFSKYDYMLLSKPLELITFDVMVPVLYEEIVSRCYHDFMINIVVLLLISTIFFAWSFLIKVDRITWRFLTIFEMILGNGNARSPVTRSEMVGFSCEIMVGFFFGSVLVSGLTSTAIVKRTEKEILSFEDMTANNITFYPLYDPKSFKFCQFAKNIVESKVRIKYLGTKWPNFKFIRTMALHKNISVTIFTLEKNGVIFPRQIVINERLQAKKSNVKEAVDVSVCIMQTKVCPVIKERFNSMYWRIMETKLTDVPAYHESTLRKWQYKYVNSELEKLEMDFGENDMFNAVDLHNLWMILSFGLAASLISFIYEIVRNACSSTPNQIWVQ